MMTGVKASTLRQGTFNVSPYNFLKGSVATAAFDRALLVLGRENINRAVQGDQVVVEILPKDQWKQPSTKIRKALIEEAKKSQGLSFETRPQPTARIVGIVKRNWRYYVGHIDPSSVSSERRRAANTHPEIRIRTRQAAALLGKRVVVSIDTWDRLRGIRSGILRTKALLLEWDVQYRPFPKAFLDCLPKEVHDWKVPENKQRKDYRDLLICSIDPPGCQDIDDALHARVLPNGKYEIGSDNPMDDEAIARGTTAFSYEQAQIRIDDNSFQDEVMKGMRVLLMLSKKLKQKRMDAGALNFASSEVKIYEALPKTAMLRRHVLLQRQILRSFKINLNYERCMLAAEYFCPGTQGRLEAICKNINIHHRNAHFAGRASVESYVGQALKNHETEEEGFVMRM
ncbi:hypothetical protein L211DRAFT_855312 [Terfezia boudieri ATCC MYA-4762]|uniref:RNB domain-containing protein n=1 Tax=Terfezia boudieri ATCC MYA-4762 TaxID=1051890 RepID=A0A3N4LZQ5_9PEZI|nr:hypothetical protein L211DRAFT_855312 [Terfezia boudieri ATCC MYA-4762]